MKDHLTFTQILPVQLSQVWKDIVHIMFEAQRSVGNIQHQTPRFYWTTGVRVNCTSSTTSGKITLRDHDQEAVQLAFIIFCKEQTFSSLLKLVDVSIFSSLND